MSVKIAVAVKLLHNIVKKYRKYFFDNCHVIPGGIYYAGYKCRKPSKGM